MLNETFSVIFNHCELDGDFLLGCFDVISKIESSLWKNLDYFILYRGLRFETLERTSQNSRFLFELDSNFFVS